MNKILLAACAGLMLSGSAAHAITLTFDDAGAGGVVNSANHLIQDDGFSFNAIMSVFDVTSPFGYSYTGPAHSGLFAAANNNPGDAEITKTGGGTFSFQDLWFRPWGNEIPAGTVEHINGYLNNVLVSSVAFTLTGAWQDVTGNFGLVDRLEVAVAAYDAFVLDDVTLDASPVPEPASLALLDAGLGGLCLLIRRRRAV